VTDSGTNKRTQEMSSASAKPLAIIGIGCLFPQAGSKEAYWANIKGGVDSISDVPETHWRLADLYDPDPKKPDHTYGKRGGFLDPVDFNPMEFSIQPNILEAIDTSQLLGLIAAREALRDAGYDPQSDFARERVSVLLGVTGALEMVIPLGARLGHPQWRKALKDAGVPDDVAQDVVDRIADSYVPWQENSFPGLLGNVVAGRISKQFDLGGTNSVVDAACGSSLSAVHMAAMELACGRSDMVITGGIDTFNDIFMYTCFSKTPALSPSNIVRPFDHQSDGTLIGEGLGLIALKRLEDAERDNDHIYAVIRGIGAASDGKGGAIYEPSADGQKRTLIDAYRQSGIDPRTITLLEAHGTGTKVGDATEIRALREVYGESDGRPWCALGSVKSQIGHTKAAAGSAGLIKAALALYHKVLPPTINVEQPQDVITSGNSPFYVNTTIRPWLPHSDHPRRAAVSAFGFGGSNFHCVLEEYLSEHTSCDWSGAPLLFALCGDDRQALVAELSQLKTLSADQLRRAAAKSRTAFNPQAKQRLLFVVESAGDLNKVLTQAEQLVNGGKTLAGTPNGLWYGQGAPDGKLAVLFPGQGAQYVHMLADLACHAPQLLQTLQDADDVLDLAEGNLLSQVVYPHSLFSDQARQQADQQLQATQHAQPAIGTVSLGAWNYLSNHYGIAAEAFAGHSYGELTALCAAGCFASDDLFRLSHLRGQLMAGDGSDKGTMLAVSAPLADIEAMIRDENLCLVLANHNTPNQGVLSGEREEIARAQQLCQQRGMRCTPLDVAAAFHSPLVAAASKPFYTALQEISLQSPKIPVYANKTALPYPEDSGQVATLLAEQIANPVKFVRQIEQMYADGVRTFLEVGPGARLTGMVKKILADKSVETVALDASNGKRSGLTDLGRMLVQLAAIGYPLHLERWDGEFTKKIAQQPEPKPAKMTVTLTGANYVKEKPARPASQRRLVDADSIVTPPATASPVTSAPVQQASREDVAALKSLQESMAVLQRMQEDTARLHQQFLEGQASAVDAMRALMDHQHPTPLSSPQPSRIVTASPATVAVPSVQPAPVAPVAVAAPVTTTAAPGVAVQGALLDVVAEKTGYPKEMLELDMSLDADLGIDSIKRVEILSAMQEAVPGLPAVQPDQLGSLQTLRQIVDALGAAAPVAVAPLAAPVAAAVTTGVDVQGALLDVVAEKTGYPKEMLELDMSLDADLGIDSIKRVEILSAMQEAVPGLPAVQPDQLGSLQTLRQIVDALGAAVTTGVDVQGALLDVVAEKTGYPKEMLELDMSLDADLGIDSIKRVEILSAMQEAVPGLPAVQPDQLGSLQTLRQIVDALGAAAPAAVAPLAAPVAAAVTTGVDVQGALLDVVAEKTGYPKEMLELDMSLDADLGIDSIKRVEILSAMQEAVPGLPAVQPDQLGSLQTLRQIVDALGAEENAECSRCACSENTTEATTTPSNGASDATIQRQVVEMVPVPAQRQPYALATDAPLWLVDDCSSLVPTLATALKHEGYPVKIVSPSQTEVPERLSGLVVIAPEIGSDSYFLRDAFSLVQRCAPALKRQSEQRSACLVTVSRLDGHCGFNSNHPLRDPLSGALAGLCKTASLEWPELTCKAIDLGDDLSEKEHSAALLEELLLTGPLEVGISRSERVTPALVEHALAETVRPLTLSADDIVVISGGARGVTAEVAEQLAMHGNPTLLLLGRSELPQPEPEWLTNARDEAEIKRALMTAAETPLKPRELNEQCGRILQQRELTANIQRLEQAGSKVIYKALDIRSESAVKAALDDVRSLGTIRGLIHGAGVLADRKIEDKTLEQFDQVYSTKIAGLQALLHASESDPLQFIVLFSSSTARFGRVGQVDYAMANEVLNKTAQALARQKSDCRVVSINWGPWDGGMVTPALKKLFAAEGIDVIDLKAGSRYLLEELNSGDPAVEIVILGGHGAPDKNIEAVPPVAAPSSQPAGAEIYPQEALTLQVSVADMPVLKDHVIDGKAVVPMAMIVEWLAHAAMHLHPGMQFIGFDKLRINKGIRLAGDETCALELRGQAGRSDNDQLVVPMQIISTASQVVHASGEIILSSFRNLTAPAVDPVAVNPAQAQSKQQIYTSGQLFHGPALQGLQAVQGESAQGIVGVSTSSPAPGSWMNTPLRYNWLAEPQVLDSSFQMMILWCYREKQQGSLPMYAGSYRQYREGFDATAVRIQCRIGKQNGQVISADIDFIDEHNGELIARLQDYQCTMIETLTQSFANNTLN
jgi:acyl transferase domain-containing protein